MGLRLGKIFRSTFKRVPAITAAFATGGASLLAPGGMMGLLKPGGFQNGIGGGVPSIQSVVQRNGGLAVPAMAAVPQVGALGIRLLTQNAAKAIMKLALIFGIPVALSNLGSVGRRLFRAFRVFARRHPTISIISMLTALGLTVEEASEWFFWGEATAKRRRGRGISARDIRTCRRTMRRMASFQRDMFRAAPRRRGVRGGGPSTLIAQN